MTVFGRDLFQDLSINFVILSLVQIHPKAFKLYSLSNKVRFVCFFANRSCALLDCKLCTLYNKHIPAVQWDASDPQ